jgi:hypothetical protein
LESLFSEVFILEIIKQAKGDSGEIIAWNEKDCNVREEVNRRTAKAGLSTKYGEYPYSTKIQTTVPCGETKLNVWPRDENGQLIDD